MTRDESKDVFVVRGYKGELAREFVTEDADDAKDVLLSTPGGSHTERMAPLSHVEILECLLLNDSKELSELQKRISEANAFLKRRHESLSGSRDSDSLVKAMGIAESLYVFERLLHD